MIVVADSGPLHYLILLGHIELLRRFYGQVLVSLSPMNFPLLARLRSLKSGSRNRPPGLMCAP